MRYLIIGLGIYGYNLARNLTDMGHEVIGADNNKANIDAIKDYISTVYYLDATEDSSIAMLPLNNVDLAIVAIGENFGASIKVVAMLKKLKVKHIFARASDPLHASILEGFQIDRILTPEQRAARDLTNELGLGANVQSLSVDDSAFVLKFRVPGKLVGTPYADLDLKRSYGITLMAVTRPVEKANVMGIKRMTPKILDFTAQGVTVGADDTLVCMGTHKDFASFYRHLATV